MLKMWVIKNLREQTPTMVLCVITFLDSKLCKLKYNSNENKLKQITKSSYLKVHFMENLKVLAEFYDKNITGFGTFGNKLSITPEGKFVKVSGVKGAWGRSFGIEQSFVSTRIQDLIKDEFEKELDNISRVPDINNAMLSNLSLVCRALKGHITILEEYKIDLRATLYAQGTRKAILDIIKSNIKKIILHDRNIYTKFDKNQRTFLANQLGVTKDPNQEVDFVDGGICWGIAAKWCQRWVGDKKGFQATSKVDWTINNMFDAPLLHHTPDALRFQKKSIEMFTLMKLQNTISLVGGSLRKVGGELALAMRIFTPDEELKNSKKYNLLMKEKKVGSTAKMGPNEVSEILFKSNQRDKVYANFNDYIEKVVAKYEKLFFDAREYIDYKRTGKIDHCDGAQEVFLRATIDKIIQKIEDDGKNFGNHPVAFIVSWSEKSGGHAMACAIDQNKWYFMDPNYGEWRGSKEDIKDIILLLASLYSLSFKIIKWSTHRLRHT